MPKRGAIATVLTGFALVLLLNFKTPSQQGITLPGTGAVFGASRSPAAVGSAAPSTVPGGGSAASVAPSTSPAPSAPPASAAPTTGSSTGGSSGSGGSSSASGGSSSGSGSASASTPAPAANAAPTPTPAAKSSSYTGQVTSPVAQTPYGPVQIQVTFSSGKITDVKALQLPTSHFQSLQISNYVAPILRQQALQVQSAHIYGVSGATYTSIGYAQTLQAAIDQAHA